MLGDPTGPCYDWVAYDWVPPQAGLPPQPHEPTMNSTADTAARPTPAPAAAPLPLAQRVADAIRDMIVQDELAPGERIRERDLAARLDVSRTPMREAIRILTTEGLVESSPNRSARVSDPTPREVRDMLRVLGTLEALAGELACAEADDAEIDEVRALHYEMLAAFARKDRLDYFKINQKIHIAIVAASHNAPLIELHRQLNARLYRVRYQSNLKSRTWPTAVDQHDLILEALQTRDGEALREILRRHLDNAWVKVSDLMAGPEETL